MRRGQHQLQTISTPAILANNISNDMHLTRSVCIMPATYSHPNQEHLYQHSFDMINNYDSMSSSIMRTNSTKSTSYGGAGTAKQFTLSKSAIKTNSRIHTDYNYDFSKNDNGEDDDDDNDANGIKYFDTNTVDQHSTFYVHSNGNISDKNVAIGANGYRSHSPRSSISDSGSSVSNSNSNSSTNNNNPASFLADESTTRSICASSSNSNATLTTNNDWLKQPNKINNNYCNNNNDIVNNNDDDNSQNTEWINSNSNANVANRVNYSNYIDDNNYANNNNQPNRNNNSRTSRRTSSLRVYH